MRVPLSWLREFTPVEAGADELAQRLPIAGLQVEEVVRTGSGIEGVVVGKVLEINEIPGATKIIHVVVDVGASPREIVCGARNFAVGDLVPVALPGAKLPNGMEIARREMHGKASDGMLCSADELRISDDHTGIFVLDGDLKPGQDLREALQLDDEVLEIDVTPNRPDLLSIVGVAREVAALYELPFTVAAPAPSEEGADTASMASVAIEDRKGCPRYLARVITGVRGGASPWWMRRRLLAAGMRPISGSVDVTNYVLIERGHPLHAFDLSTLRGNAIVVRRPKKGEERFLTLDGSERTLTKEDLVICDAERPVAIAGIMGGAETEVGEGTADILLESAYFDPARIGRTARRLGLRTEASIRFERGADPEGVPAAAARAAQLLGEVCGGVVARAPIDVHPKPARPRSIRLRVPRTNRLLGVTVPASEMGADLTSLGCTVRSQTRTTLQVLPPTFRPDLRTEVDLVEEVARRYSYDRLPSTLPASGRAGGLSREQELRRLTRRLLLGSGLSEAHTLSMLPPRFADRLGLAGDHPWRRTLTIANPLSEEESVLRPSLLPGLLLAAAKNVARRNVTVTMFEIGGVFLPSDRELPDEPLRAAWLLAGPAPGGWHSPQDVLDYFDAAGVLERLISGLGVDGVARSAATIEPFHTGRSARITLGGSEIGIVAELHPRSARRLDLLGRVAVGEIDLAPVFSRAREAVPGELPRFPAAVRDLALVVPATATAAEVEATIRRAAGPLLDQVAVFDVYRGTELGEGRVGLAFSLAFRDPERTLTDAEVAARMGEVDRASREAGWTVR
jgi:phenylalanyl-tRNA synthetase beta chain